MKQWVLFTLAFVVLAAALVTSQKQRIDAPVSPDAALSLIADTEHELTRLPVSFARLPDGKEIEIGNRLARDYEQEGIFAQKLPSTAAVQAYVNRVGARVAVGAHRKLPYRFHYISNPGFVNAFALPGGHVFIGGGLMALMDSEDELANVLGHEVEHIDHYHCAERVQTEAALEKVPLGELLAIPVEVFETGYSKTQELEADREGARLAVQAHYSPLGAVRMFQTFDRLYHEHARRAQSPQEELSDLAWQTLEGYFRSHPFPAERMAQIQQLISDQHWEGMTGEQPLQVEYVYLTQRAERDLEARNYAAAEGAATRSLNLKLNQLDALTILTRAQFALLQFPDALANYHQILNLAPPQAAVVGEFANSMAANALHARHFDQAVKYATASLDLQSNNAPALTVLAEARMSSGDFAGAESTYQQLARLYPDAAEAVVTYTRAEAERALTDRHYEQARDEAGFWLKLQPSTGDAFGRAAAQTSEAVNVRAQAELALGDFAAAAKSFRYLLDLPRISAIDARLVWSYADALSAANLGQAGVKDFRDFMQTPHRTSTLVEDQIRIEYVGLALMAGDSSPAQQLAAANQRMQGDWISPELLTRLGWWYYRAGKYAEAETLLRSLARQRPGDLGLQNDLAWVELEQNEFDAAIQQFRRAEWWRMLGYGQWNTPQMGLALALWRSRQADEALKDYQSATNIEPRWKDNRLVQAFYSPRVTQAITEMQTEQARRNQPGQRRAGVQVVSSIMQTSSGGANAVIIPSSSDTLGNHQWVIGFCSECLPGGGAGARHVAVIPRGEPRRDSGTSAGGDLQRRPT